MTHRAVLLLATLALLIPGAAVAAQDEELAIPTEWRTHYAWFLVANPEYTPASKRADSVLTAAHIQYQLRLQHDGNAIAAGGLGPGDDRLTIGPTILRADNLDAAKALAEGDPAVKAGRILARVREWWVPAKHLP